MQGRESLPGVKELMELRELRGGDPILLLTSPRFNYKKVVLRLSFQEWRPQLDLEDKEPSTLSLST
jgi:hypothetical protein